MHGIAAFYETQTNGLTYDPLNVVVDQSLTPAQSQGYIFPANYRVLGAFVMGANVTAARINAPSLRQLALPEIYPALASATVTSRPPFVDYNQQGPIIMQNEAVVIETSNGGGAPAVVHGALWITDRFTPAPGGQIFTLVATATITLVAGAWTLGTLTFNQTLPTGEFTVVGMECIFPTSSIARLVFPGQNQWRPGCLIDLAYGNMVQPSYFRMGRMGMFGKFRNTAQPQVEVFGLTAGAQTGTIMIDVIKTGT